MLPQEIIRRKRDAQVLSPDEIAAFVRGLTDDSFSEGQIAALAMAVVLNGMDRAETVALTRAMRDSGRVLDWSDLPGPVTDKHSTGGVGDNVSLVLAPIVAACGAFVPMISGRGLGHSGGTLDKMDSIPGYITQPDEPRFRQAVKGAGCAIVGASGDLAPADKRFYAVRDVTGTVDSVPLITASILSKKLAAGLGSLVLDVKCGSGAFMTTLREAFVLAQSLVSVAGEAGLSATALVTGMDEPLASCAGNGVEVLNAVDFLTGRARDARLEEVVLALATEMLGAANLAPTRRDATAKASEALSSGRAADVFGRMVHLLGGPSGFIDDPSRHLAPAPVERAVEAGVSGFVSAIDTRALGLAVVALGGGRRRPDAPIDHAVGLTRLAALGEHVEPGHPLALVHARTSAAADEATYALRAAYTLAPERPVLSKPVLRRVVSE